MRRLAPLTLAAALTLAGCGQKGPLYLPGDEAATEPSSEQPQAPGEEAPRQDADTARDDES
ncbi:lipoprotein [Halomonas sp.]|uniref:Putative small lipoprotein YifL n=1 Tax=Halomonas ventosae TaxID=229007 RepID=A0A4R6HEN9_9GAMM|nr:putative small lipoprotein YifL [Halomonas ventosae]